MRLHGLSRRGFTAGSYLITLGTAVRRRTNRAERMYLYPRREGERERHEDVCKVLIAELVSLGNLETILRDSMLN